MQTTQLIKRSLAYYWQTNLVVVLGVAIAVSVLAGALLIGESVRGSLRDLSARRLGKTDDLISAPNFFREQLAADLEQRGQFVADGIGLTCPLIALDGVVIHESSKRRAGGVKVYGVDERFWKFNGVANVTTPENRNVLVSHSLASELGSVANDSLLLRIEKPSAIPVESLHGRKEDVGKSIRLSVAGELGSESLGEFSLQPQHGAVRALFVSLAFLQRELGPEVGTGRVNTILVSRFSRTQAAKQQQNIASVLKEKAALEDLGLRVRAVDNNEGVSLESTSRIINEHVAAAASEAAKAMSLRTVPLLSYLANSINAGERSTPYSLVTAVDDETLAQVAGKSLQTSAQPPIVLNEWTARDLNAKPGDAVSLEYYLWHEDGRLETKKADFQLAAVVPISGLAADRDLVPEYPGISDSEDMSAWDPPFPIDLGRVRKEDEDYWHQYRTTPKAFIPLATAQQLWQTRFGKLTSIRAESLDKTLTPAGVNAYGEYLRKALDPALMGFQIVAVRDQGQQASHGATDFGEYFLYFSFFLVVAALMLTTLFFKLGIEQRAREIGTLQAIGFSDRGIRRLFLIEGTLLASIGSLLGLVGAIAYAALLMYGLRTWWVDAVGTTDLRLHVSWLWLVVGAVGGVAAAVACIFFTLRRLGRSSTRGLLAGGLDSASGAANPRLRRRYLAQFGGLFGIVLTLAGIALLVLGGLKLIPQAAGFFGGGVVLLVAAVTFISRWLKRPNRSHIHGAGWWTIARLGFRNATYRPGRTTLCITLIASAAFIIVAVDSFRRSGVSASDRKSGTGGYPLLAESLLPVVHDPNTREGRESLNLNTSEATLKNLSFVSLRVRPGDDTSCLNLYQPRNPKIVAPPESFIHDNRFTFQSSIANTTEEKNNPWLLLDRGIDDGAVPVIGDANSLTYVLHLKVGDEMTVDHANGPLKLRIVAALSDSIFQSELLMSEKNFLRLFPSEEGFRMFLIDVPDRQQAAAASTLLEERLSDFGFDAVSTEERLANFHRVENTYLSTFQMLGGLGLALGTLGMAAVLLRNVFERRKELALLRAVGYNSSHFAAMVITENVLMLGCGLAVGFVCALLAIAPVIFERGGRLPNISLGLLLLAVLLSGATASLVATLAALRSPLLPSLRAE